MTKTRGILGIAAIALWMAPAFAGQLTVSSYTINTPTEPSYPDESGIQLTDGLFGPVNLFGDTTNWVGWANQSSISMTFHFASLEVVDSVAMDFLNEVSGVFTVPPQGATINGQVFSIGAGDIPDNSSGFVTFDLSPDLTTNTVTIVLDHSNLSNFHLLADEVQFFGTAVTQGAVPEPTTILLVCAGLLTFALARRKSGFSQAPSLSRR